MKNVVQMVVDRGLNAAKAIVAALVAAVVPVLVDTFVDLSSSSDVVVAAVAGLVLVYLVPNKQIEA